MELIWVFLSSGLSFLLSGAIFVWLGKRNRARWEKNANFERFQWESRFKDLQEVKLKLEEQIHFWEKERMNAQSDHADLRKENTNLIESNARLTEKLVAQKDYLNQYKLETERLRKQFEDRFEQLAAKIFEAKAKSFSEQSTHRLSTLLEPFRIKIDGFQSLVKHTFEEDLKDRSALRQQLTHLTELNKQMSEEAHNLTRALKGDSKTQGNWGEVILERILEKSGLRKGHEYDVQVSHKTESGRRLQPDVIVYLPDDKCIIIDAKVSLTAFERFISLEDATEAEQALTEHVQSLKQHIKGLDAKNYAQLHGSASPDFVLLFLPIQPAFDEALKKEPSLYDQAFQKNVILVSPTTLLATLSTISSVWKQEYRSQHAEKIAQEGAKLYDKFVGFVDDLESIGQRLRQTDDAYLKAMNKLSTGQGNLISKAESLRGLGVQPKKSLPQHLTQRDEE